MHLIGIFLEPDQVGGLVDTLKNAGIERQDMIISSYDEEKFAKMEAAVEAPIKFLMADREDLGEIDTFIQGVHDLKVEDPMSLNGIVVSVKCAKNKSQEVRSVMEQSGALNIVVK